MLLDEITCWFFTESRFRENNPFSRFETEMLDSIGGRDSEMTPAQIEELKKAILERTERIFESDLSWGQNIYSRDNLRWVSFIAGYTLTMRETVDEAKPHIDKLKRHVSRYGTFRFKPLWMIIARTIIITRRTLPSRRFIRKIRISSLLRHSHLPFTCRSNWIGQRNSFYENFFTAHSCPEICETFDEIGRTWRMLLSPRDLT